MQQQQQWRLERQGVQCQEQEHRDRPRSQEEGFTGPGTYLCVPACVDVWLQYQVILKLCHLHTSKGV